MFGKKKKTEEGKEEAKEAGEPAAEAGAQGEGEEKKEEKEAGGVGAMRPGDYMVHVFVEKLKDINMPEGSDTVDPMITVECLGMKTYSSAKDNIGPIGVTNYSEHLFLEPRGVDKPDAESAKIMIKLMDKGLFKDALIGQFEFDMSYIYFMKDHTLLHKWLALSNPNGEDYAKIQAYLKVSISVACQGDEQIQITDDTNEREDTNVMMSPALNPKFYQIKLRVFAGMDLSPMDAGIGFLSKDKIDAYVLLHWKGKKFKTKAITQAKGEGPVHWNMEFWLNAQIPVMSPKIELRLMDEDDIGADEMSGTLSFNTIDILQGKQKQGFCWKNVYGSPLNQKSSKAKTLMNEHPEYASNWKGRILFSAEAYETDKPLAKCVPIEEEVVKQAEKALANREFACIAQVGQAVCLPSTKNYTIKVTIGGFEIRFKALPQSKPLTYKRFEKMENQVKINLPYVDIYDFGKVIVSLMDEKDDPVCYFISDIDNFLDVDPKMKWYSFLPDKCVNKVKEPFQVGQISFKMSLHDVTKNGPIDFSQYKAWKQKGNKRFTAIKVRAYIYQCRDLPAADSNGTSDPYIQVWDTTATDKVRKQTKIVEDNCNPLFYQTIEMDYEVENEDDLESYPPFIFDVFDHDDDLFDKTPDFLCRAIVEPEDCSIIMHKDFNKCEAHKNDNCKVVACLVAFCKGHPDQDCDEFCDSEVCNNGQNHRVQNCKQCPRPVGIPSRPRWHPCFYAPGTPQSGEILVSFSVTKEDYEYPVPAERLNLGNYIKFRDMNVNMLILGLRNLQSSGILPVKKAFITFNVKSLVPPDGLAVKNIQTIPKAPGPNPTLNSTMKFQIPLPTDPLYCPRLSCFVYDYIFKGWNQPLVGVFVIPIGELMHSLAEERKSETARIKEIIDKITEMLQGNNSIVPLVGMRNFAINDDNSRSQSEYSRADDEDENQKMITKKKKKKAVKALKKDENLVNYSEELGANENEGIKKAVNATESQLELAKNLKSQLRNRVDSINQKQFDPLSQPKEGKKKLNKNEMQAQMKEAEELQKRIEKDERNRDKEELLRQGVDAYATIVMAKYKMDERLKVDREVDAPPPTLFMPLGWDEFTGQGRKHYRKFYKDELENDKSIFPQQSPFNSYELKRGQTRGASNGMFSSAQATDASGQASTEQVVGVFKSIVEVENPEDNAEYQRKKAKLLEQLIKNLNELSMKVRNEPFVFDPNKLSKAAEREKFETYVRSMGCGELSISQALTNLNSDVILRAALLKEEKCVIRFYAVNGFDMSSRDNGSASDTYLKLECNGKVYSERENYQLDQPNPDFYKMYDFEGYFPGSSPLKIQVWDYDAIFGDELIGTTFIDLEDRYFTLDWVGLKEKPIEERQLYHPSSKMSQGVVRCWLEINPVNIPPADQPKVWDIQGKPPIELEVRICVLNCEGIPMMDAEGTCDAYFRGFFDTNEEVQETDTHFRCTDGKPDFQYRLVYKIKYPRKDCKFTLQGYDRDFFKSNDMFGQAEIDLKTIIDDVSLIKAPLALNKKYSQQVPKLNNANPFQDLVFDKEDENKFYLTLYTKDKKGNLEKAGKVGMKVDILPISLAEKNPVGKARDNPNHSPSLPAPQGRLELSLNPVKMLMQMVGPALRRKIIMYCFCALCCGLFIMILPNILGGFIVALI